MKHTITVTLLDETTSLGTNFIVTCELSRAEAMLKQAMEKISRGFVARLEQGENDDNQ